MLISPPHQAVFYRRRANDDQSEACILQADLGWLGCSLTWIYWMFFLKFITSIFTISFHRMLGFYWLILYYHIPSIAKYQSISPLWPLGPMEWTHKFLRISHLKYLKATGELPKHWCCIFMIFAPSTSDAYKICSLYESITEDQQRTQWRPCCWLLGSTFEMAWAWGE